MKQLKMYHHLLLLFYMCKHFGAELLQRNGTSNEKTFIEIDNILQTYDKRVRPCNNGRPLTVMCQVDFVKFHPLQYEGTFTLDIYIRTSWNDFRLRHNATKYITYPGASSNDWLWQPNIFFVNGLKSFKHDVLAPNQYVRLWPNGDILTSTRVTVEADCPQDLTNYPFDVQVCKLNLESYSYDSDDLALEWRNNSALMLLNSEMSQFVVTKATLHKNRNRYISGVFDSLYVKIFFQRRIGHYVFQVFIPCNVIVLLSFLTFWMNPDDVGDRLAVGITTVLTVVFLMQSINNHLPKVSYAKAIDGYLIACFLLVFATVAETVLVFYYSSHSKKQDPTLLRIFRKSKHEFQTKEIDSRNATMIINNSSAANEDGETYSKAPTDVISKESESSKEKTTSKIDSYSKVLFPLSFVVSNLAYWLVMTMNRG
ncbi:glycine receptor subunit alpha-2-like [Rhopilema esculentum]|uniref:glycine receptor subunit alpha-2-like n=1 Tax=Rhopilema esculentum TaxID=499914 RepID=UPI0031D5BD21|eukprot:gene2846-1081_t